MKFLGGGAEYLLVISFVYLLPQVDTSANGYAVFYIVCIDKVVTKYPARNFGVINTSYFKGVE